jgi:hypothetical protein
MVLERPDRVGYLVWPRQTESQCRAAAGLGNTLRCERMLLSGRKAVNNVFVPGDGHLQVRSKENPTEKHFCLRFTARHQNNGRVHSEFMNVDNFRLRWKRIASLSECLIDTSAIKSPLCEVGLCLR